MTNLLFVYGTLAPGDDAWPLLAPFTIGPSRPDAAAGALFDTGAGYPAATFAADASGLVHGVVVELDPDRHDEALTALDGYEGPQYRRITVRTTAGLDVFTYAWTDPLAGCVPITDGRWRRSFPPTSGR